MLYDQRTLKHLIDQAKYRTSNLPPEEAEARIQEVIDGYYERVEAQIQSLKGEEFLSEGGRFDTLSLLRWIDLAREASVAYVPAKIVGWAEHTELMAGRNMPAVDLSKVDGPGIVRLDYAAGARVKIDRAFAGQGKHSGTIGVYQKDGEAYLEKDPRVVDLSFGFVGDPKQEEVPVVWRPWIEAQRVAIRQKRFLGRREDSWPLEWRVFVKEGKVRAISAYYIQAPVRKVDDFVQASAENAIVSTQAIVATMKDRGIQPWHPRYMDKVDVNDMTFMLDFIAQPGGTAILLEGGPACLDPRAPSWGSHPCFFEGRDLDGWALSYEDVHPLPVRSDDLDDTNTISPPQP